jgi:hypothetical protein
MRIAKERNMNVMNLKGTEFSQLKEYQRMEERKELLNNMDDFFDY